MITSPPPPSSSRPGLARRTLPLVACAWFAASAFAAEPKPYTLFLGTDFAVQQEKVFHRVLDVTGGSFIVRIDNREVAVPMRVGTGNLKVDQGFKLSRTSARIEKLKTERAYTPENDPNVKFAGRVGTGAADSSNQLVRLNMEAAQSFATGQGMRLGYAAMAGNATEVAHAAVDLEQANVVVDQSTKAFSENSYSMNFSDINNTGLAALELQEELAAENFDAMRYSFEVSSEVPLNRPYLVFVLRYHEKDAKPGTGAGTVIYAKSIAAIGTRPSKINILQTGMPIGFIVDDCQVHLYNNGQEVATNVAPRRMEMSKDEAFLYLKIDRLGRAKGATLPAAPAIGRLDESTRAQLSNDQLRNPYFVKVNKDGHAEGVFVDQDCSKAADDTISGLVHEMRFFPALENGKELPGVAKLFLPQLMI